MVKQISYNFCHQVTVWRCLSRKLYREEQELIRKCMVEQMIRHDVNFIISSLQNFQYVHHRLWLQAASVKWHDQLLLGAVLMESEQHVAVCSSSHQPEIGHIPGRHDPSSIPTARNHMDSHLAGQGFGKLLEIMCSSVKVSRSIRWTWRPICGDAPSCLKTMSQHSYVLARQESHTA